MTWIPSRLFKWNQAYLQPKLACSPWLEWFLENGRHTLPWKKRDSVYDVWISEIMLQQTQVNTVIPYFNRFIERFPNIESLATSSEQDVLIYWSGLGYYRRARYIHQTAQRIHAMGIFPDTLDALIQLPGIGLSTAGAILSLGFKKSGVILDGNVKRIISRYHGIEEPILSNSKDFLALLRWHLPESHFAEYTQTLMDVGSMICLPKKPLCEQCPFQSSCVAYQTQSTHRYPAWAIKKKKPPIVHLYYMIFKYQQSVWIELRRDKGIWERLWSFPSMHTDSHLQLVKDQESIDLDIWMPHIHLWLEHQHAYHGNHWMIDHITPMPDLSHVLTHRSLRIHSFLIHVKIKEGCFFLREPCSLPEDLSVGMWCSRHLCHQFPFPVPIFKLMELAMSNDERFIYCVKHQKELKGLLRRPFKDALGQKVYDHISEAAWMEWLNQQTKIINEYRLDVLDPQAKQFLRAEMHRFLFNSEWSEA